MTTSEKTDVVDDVKLLADVWFNKSSPMHGTLMEAASEIRRLRAENGRLRHQLADHGIVGEFGEEDE